LAESEERVDIREHIATALDSLGYDSVEKLIRDAILDTRDVKQTAICPDCHRKFTIDVKQPAPDKRAKAIQILADQAKGAPGRAAEKPKKPSMTDELTNLTTAQLEELAAGE
jgi:hypothetical protein